MINSDQRQALNYRLRHIQNVAVLNIFAMVSDVAESYKN